MFRKRPHNIVIHSPISSKRLRVWEHMPQVSKRVHPADWDVELDPKRHRLKFAYVHHAHDNSVDVVTHRLAEKDRVCEERLAEKNRVCEERLAEKNRVCEEMLNAKDRVCEEKLDDQRQQFERFFEDNVSLKPNKNDCVYMS